MNTQSSKFSVIAAVSVAALYADIAFGDSVILWNKLGSESEVMNSEFGPNGVISPGAESIDYLPVQFGDGVRVNGSWTSGTEIRFGMEVVTNLGDRGTMALWVRPDHDSNDGDIGRWTIWNGELKGIAPHIYWRGWDQGILYQVCTPDFGCGSYPPALPNSLLVPNTVVSFAAGEVFHVAIVWDQSGIDGTADTLRGYFNGKLVGAGSPRWKANQNMQPLSLGNGDYAQRAAVDNLVIYDYAKTDFSDRFNENPAGKTFAAFTPRAEFKLGPKANDDAYWVRGWLKLANTSNGIDPLTEAVTIKIGPFSHTLPAGSFTQDGASYLFKGPVGPSTLDVRITASPHPGGYSFKSCLKKGELAATTMKPQVQLTIGDDSGQATLDVGYAKFGKGADGQNWVFPTAK